MILVVSSPLKLREEDIFIGDNYQSRWVAMKIYGGWCLPNLFFHDSGLGTDTVRDFCWFCEDNTSELANCLNLRVHILKLWTDCTVFVGESIQLICHMADEVMWGSWRVQNPGISQQPGYSVAGWRYMKTWENAQAGGDIKCSSASF